MLHVGLEIAACETDFRKQGADHPYVPLLMTAPGIGWVLAYTIAGEIGDIQRFSSPKKLCAYTGLCADAPVQQSRRARRAGQERTTIPCDFVRPVMPCGGSRRALCARYA